MRSLSKRRGALAVLSVGTVAAAVLMARGARADGDALALPDSDLKALCEKSLKSAVAAVCTQGTPQLALDDDDVVTEGPHVPAASEVLAGLRAAAGAAKVKLIKHADDVSVPMVRARASTLSRTTVVETTVDHELYLEVEGANRELLHAQIDIATRTGPGGPAAGNQSPASLDAIAEKFLRSWTQEKRADAVTVLGNPKPPRPLAQSSLAQRVALRLLHKTRLIATSRASGQDVARPAKVVLLAPSWVLVVSFKEDASRHAVLIEAVDTSKNRSVYLFRDPEAPAADRTTPRPVGMIKSTAEGLLFKMNGRYPRKKGARSKVWLCDADIDPELLTPELKQQLTTALRSTLLARELADYLFEAHDGDWTNDQAKAADAFLTVVPRFYMEKGQKICGLQIRLVGEDKVLENSVAIMPERKGP